ncbi:MAG: AAA family ATPase [Desulfuromonas sp.]|nr:AAA family ATPase [Desulfuromonas sp.]
MAGVLEFISNKVKRISRQGKLADTYDDYRPFLGIWLLELALMLGWYDSKTSRKRKRFNWPDAFYDDDFRELTGIEVPPVPDDDDESCSRSNRWDPGKTAAKKILQRRLAELRKEKISKDLPLFRNISLLAEILGLTRADQALLAFTVIVMLFQEFRGAIASRCVKTSHHLLCQILSRLSGVNEDEFHQSLGENGLLVGTGMIKISIRIRDLEEKLEISSLLVGVLMRTYNGKEALASRFVRRAAKPGISLDSFPHLQQDTEILLPYLRKAAKDKVAGVNILLSGRPGVGKTEYARCLAEMLGLELYEIAYADDDGDSIKGEARLQAYNFCQRLLARSSNTVIVFDEIEDVFPQASIFESRGEQIGGKAWVNRTMESNLTPAIWISNNIDQIDPAYLRRFDYSIEIPTPPRGVRLSIARHHLKSFVPSTGWLERIAANEDLAPAQLERAARVARLAAGTDRERARQLVDQVLERSCRLLNCSATPTGNVLRTGYRLDRLNTDADIPGILEGLKCRPKGTFCFYGDAGTGKSELARYLADQTGRPAIVRRASDILGKYVGESERNIARMFNDARSQGAVLILDEADSFLTDRRTAQKMWEVTMVNELLTQMESFEGIFICTTNLMDKMDQASLRRFAFKVRFFPLTSRQRVEMFHDELIRLGEAVTASGPWAGRVAELDGLTPGDFSVAARQLELTGAPATAERFYNQLEKECAARTGTVQRRIGFAV